MNTITIDAVICTSCGACSRNCPTRSTCLVGMLLCLGAEERAAFVLGGIFRLPSAELAAALGLSPAAARKRLSRARIARYIDPARAAFRAGPSAVPDRLRARFPSARDILSGEGLGAFFGESWLDVAPVFVPKLLRALDRG